MNILFFGGHYWDETWFRKQHFASRLSQRGHRIFYVEDSISIIRWNNNSKNHPYKIIIRKINDNLYVITPPAFFPFPSNKLLRSIYNIRLYKKLKRILEKYNSGNFIFWFNRIEYSTLLKNIKKTKIFDLCDDLPGYFLLLNDNKAYKVQLAYLEEAFKYSDVSIVSAQKIREKYHRLASDKILLIPNGHNLDINDEMQKSLPREMLSIKKPIVGFIGTLFSFLDDKLIEFIVSQRPEYNFVFIGKMENGYPINNLKKYSNVYLLGRKPQNEINSYIQSFDVCINPFKVHEVNDSVNPVKVFEYLANKKPVVSTRMYSLMYEHISEYICFAEDNDDFLRKLDSIIIKKAINNIPASVLDDYSWDSLFNKLINKINHNSSIEL